MGITVDFNPDLALRNIKEFKEGRRKVEECIPEDLKVNEVYFFLKKGQRLYWLNNSEEWFKGEMPLIETKGDEILTRPLASIKMLEVTHFLEEGEVWTKGKYKVIDVFDLNSSKINFESYKRIK
tara:strand:+ start:35 stop:406 length:372 start_codon:yes stop_codon:yes gene_type:complete